MIEFLAEIDRTLFFFINASLANPVTDAVMPVLTSDIILRILYGAAMVILLWRGDSRLRWLVLFSALTLTLSDQLSSHLLKTLVERPRPCHLFDQLHLLVDCGAGFSMPSSHAANMFGQAALFGLAVRSTLWYLMSFAVLVAVSRVFVGVHYPGDVVAGGLLGIAVGLAVAVTFGAFEKWRKRYADHNRNRPG
ncbi:MAG: phosphatase PAP2 family protein [Candidatus Zixiibacteriota bacterium]